jgi:DNA-directed RNA polymerase specialized sigma24 family protein
MKKSKQEIKSYEEVYTHRLLRYLARRYAKHYVSADDLLQEAALTVWQAQRDGEDNPRYLFRQAKEAMLSQEKSILPTHG